MINLKDGVWYYNKKDDQYDLYVNEENILSLKFYDDMNDYIYRHTLNFLSYFETEEEFEKFIRNKVKYLIANKEIIMEY